MTSAREEAILSEHVVRLGRRNAIERTAHLLLELLNRLRAVGMVSGRSYAFPLTQQLLADTLGLSVVHVNRTLRKLRMLELIEIDGGRIFLKDIERLEKMAVYDSGHIAHKRTPPDTEKQLVEIEVERSTHKIARAR